MTHQLIKDHFSVSKRLYKYGTKGDKVKIIYEQNATCIVENEQKQRYQIRFNLLEPIKNK